jgi:isopentenyl-diphosphate delta-isomerase
MTEIAHNEEVLDLVDLNDTVVGTITHDKVFDYDNVKPYYLRAANTFIIRDDGKLWIPRRTADKKIAPNGLDFSVGEHVMSGESYEHAMVRGFDEELNMLVAESDLELFYTSSPITNPDSYYINRNYLYRYNEAPKFNPKDFVGFEWLTPQELLDRMNSGELGKRILIEITQALLGYKP